MLQRYCSSLADREVRDHVLTLLHTHLLSALPWHHVTPSLPLLVMITKVVNKYLPECHSFIGHVLVQISWKQHVREVMQVARDSGSYADATKLHSILLNLIVRISMEPSVRQCGPLQSLLRDAEGFHWELLDAASYEHVLNWYVLSCDPRVVLPLPARSNVDTAVIHLLHVAANYTPESGAFHADTSRKRVLLTKTLVRLMTNSAARHKTLLSMQPSYFITACKEIITHIQETVNATVSADDAETASRPLCAEVLAVVGHGAASSQLQEVCREAVVQWADETCHPSSAVLRALLWATARGVLQLSHRNTLLHHLLQVSLRHTECQWRELTPLLTFPATSPAAMINQAAQEGHLLAVYGWLQWKRNGDNWRGPAEVPLLQHLVDGLVLVTPRYCNILIGNVSGVIGNH